MVMLVPDKGTISEVQWRAPRRASRSVGQRAETIQHSELGPLVVDPPVVLAPMAGVTNAAFRTLCREQGAGLYVCEMITSRGLVERDETTLAMLAFDPGESVRSVQLYGVDPVYMARAAEILCVEYEVAAHRPQLRLPGAQGDPQGRRSGAAMEASAARRRSSRRRSLRPDDTAYR